MLVERSLCITLIKLSKIIHYCPGVLVNNSNACLLVVGPCTCGWSSLAVSLTGNSTSSWILRDYISYIVCACVDEALKPYQSCNYCMLFSSCTRIAVVISQKINLSSSFFVLYACTWSVCQVSYVVYTVCIYAKVWV